MLINLNSSAVAARGDKDAPVTGRLRVATLGDSTINNLLFAEAGRRRGIKVRNAGLNEARFNGAVDPRCNRQVLRIDSHPLVVPLASLSSDLSRERILALGKFPERNRALPKKYSARGIGVTRSPRSRAKGRGWQKGRRERFGTLRAINSSRGLIGAHHNSSGHRSPLIEL